MEINWFTVIAQVLNFFILVWLLKKFLYKPILKAIDDREDKITAKLKDAEHKKAEAKKEQEDYQEKNRTFDEDKKSRLVKLKSETDEERQKLMDQARAEAESLSKKLAKAAKDQQHDEQVARNQKIQNEVFAISRKALADLASSELEDQMILVFINQLQAIKGKDLEQFKTAFTKTSDPLLIKSTLALPEKQQIVLKQAIDKMLSSDSTLKFEVAPALIGGIELSTHDYKLAWSISEYLSDFEISVAKTDRVKMTPPKPKKKIHA
jgi:F-type H+-transporting ATPase subunit b